jgi:hypothetical protein
MKAVVFHWLLYVPGSRVLYHNDVVPDNSSTRITVKLNAHQCFRILSNA